MSEKSRRKRKDDTWTKEELSAVLHKNNERPEKKEKLREKKQKSSSERIVESRSKHQALMPDEGERSNHRRKRDEHRVDDKERRSEKKERRRADHDVPRDDDEYLRAKRKAEKESRREERRRTEEIDEDEYRREKERRRKEKELRRQQRQQEEEEALLKERRHRDKSDRKHRSEESIGERERRHREKSSRKHRSDNHDVEKERRRSDKSDSRHRSEDYDAEKERKRKARKEEKKRRELEEHNARSRHSKSSSATSTVNSQAGNIDKDHYNYDDEEFEDYEDDFEDEDNDEDNEEVVGKAEVNEIIKAIARENERVASAHTLSSRSEREVSQTPSDVESTASDAHAVHATNINFAVAKKNRQGDRVRRKILKRQRDLSTLIQLDFVSFDFLELPPVTEYDFYIKSFGSRDSRQISTQCNDDALDIDIQTDSPETGEKWTQHPQDGPLACGGGSISNESRSALDISKAVQGDVQAFNSFLTYAYELIESSFVEATIWSGSSSDRKSKLSCCESSVKFNTHISYLQGRSILLAVFGDGMMALAFSSASHDFSARIDRKCIVTVWKLTDAENPYKILVSDATPTSCCFSPVNKNLLFVGTDDGCVLAYNLLEPSTMHQQVEIEKKKLAVMRGPTFTTGWIGDTHSSPVVCINTLSDDENSNQIFSLEEESRVCVWLVVDVISDVDDDVGLVPHGRVKLVKGLTLDVPGNTRSTCAACLDSKTFFVGNNNGSVVSMSREKKLMTYDSHRVGQVNSLAFSCLAPMFMLTAHDDGSVCLFHIKQESPVMSWTLECSSVLYCTWSNRRSSVFFALDSSNQFHVWDMMVTDSSPAVTNSLDKKATTFCVDQRSKTATNMLLAYESCEFEVHRLSPHFTDSVSTDEAEQMASAIILFT